VHGTTVAHGLSREAQASNQEQYMSQMTREFGLAMLISGALLAALVTKEPVSPAPRSGVTTMMRATPGTGMTLEPDRALPPAQPVTPVPVNVPDDISPGELQRRYAVGIVWLSAAAALSVALIGAIFYLTRFRNWRHSH
jgi:hypothetical protein